MSLRLCALFARFATSTKQNDTKTCPYKTTTITTRLQQLQSLSSRTPLRNVKHGLAACRTRVSQIANILILRCNCFNSKICDLNKINELAVKSDRLLGPPWPKHWCTDSSRWGTESRRPWHSDHGSLPLRAERTSIAPASGGEPSLREEGWEPLCSSKVSVSEGRTMLTGDLRSKFTELLLFDVAKFDRDGPIFTRAHGDQNSDPADLAALSEERPVPESEEGEEGPVPVTGIIVRMFASFLDGPSGALTRGRLCRGFGRLGGRLIGRLYDVGRLRQRFVGHLRNVRRLDRRSACRRQCACRRQSNSGGSLGGRFAAAAVNCSATPVGVDAWRSRRRAYARKFGHHKRGAGGIHRSRRRRAGRRRRRIDWNVRESALLHRLVSGSGKLRQDVVGRNCGDCSDTERAYRERRLFGLMRSRLFRPKRMITAETIRHTRPPKPRNEAA